MTIGTKSVLFGVHHWFFHPLAVLCGWVELYGWPTWKEFVCICIHDLGYVGCRDMNGDEGLSHPAYGASLAGKWFGPNYFWLCAGHSWSYCELVGIGPSKLYAADKLASCYTPVWLYVFLARLTGEMAEYRQDDERNGHSYAEMSDRTWVKCLRRRMREIVKERCGIET